MRGQCYRRGKQGRLLCFLTFLFGALWCIPLSAHADVVISEIMYHHPEDADYEYVELTNRGPEFVDLGDWSLAGGVSFHFPTPLLLQPGDIIVICDDVEEVERYYGLPHTVGAYDGNLAREGETLELRDPNGMIRLSVTYQPNWPWPQIADGLGPSLELKSLDADPTLPKSWALGDPYSPGMPNRAIQQTEIYNVVINEIMYHPAEDGDREYLELFNPSQESIDLTGWILSGAVRYAFPEGTTMDPGQYFLVAHSREALLSAYPQCAASLLGEYEGKLSNAGETIGLLNANDKIVDVVAYTDHDRWSKIADGDGPSLELIHPGLDNNYPDAWSVSHGSGSPGRSNDSYEADPAPLVEVLRHDPSVPGPDDPVTVSTMAMDNESLSEVHLYMRPEGQAWQSTDMSWDSVTGLWTGTIGPHQQDTIIEFYVSAEDAGGKAGLYPSAAPEITCLYQVYGREHITRRETYRVVITQASYDQDPDSLFRRSPLSDVLLNCTFIAGNDIRYQSGVRFRGWSSRDFMPPKNFRVEFTVTDMPFRGLERLNLNGVDDDPRANHPRYEYAIGSHAIGHDFLNRANQLTLDHHLVSFCINNEFWPNYIYLSAIDDVFARLHFPGDDGNLYRCTRPRGHSTTADLDWRGTDPDRYRPDYFKRTNEEEDDWSDLIDLVDILNNASEQEYVQRVYERVDVDQWMGFFATINLIGYEEGGIHAGSGTEYSMYRRESDGRFMMIPWDLDALFYSKANRTIFTQSLPPIERFIRHPEHVQLYYQKLRQLLDGPFSETEMRKATERYRGLLQDAFLDQVIEFVKKRRASVLSQLPE